MIFDDILKYINLLNNRITSIIAIDQNYLIFKDESLL